MFQEGLGTMKDIRTRWTLQEDATSCSGHPCSIPFAIKEAIERKLKQPVTASMLQKVDESEWAAPIVPISKKMVLCESEERLR